jgi:N-methylhydantoinase A/oxoprolinase/acetone carboxylase beta subunit
MLLMADLRLAVDLGGTSTDAIVLDRRDRIVARVKLERGDDDAGSIRAAVARMTRDGGADPGRISSAVLGCGAALTAIERRSELRRVAVLRIGGPLTLAIPPLATWPAPLREAVSAGEAVVNGGAEYDGRPVSALDHDGVARFLEQVASEVEAVAITGLFSSAAPDHELAAAELVRRELGASTRVSLSHEIGTIGLLERENATVLNAALGGVAERLAAILGDGLAASRIDAELFFAKGDGTVMTLEHALRFPCYLIGSGPASGIVGAAWLSGAVDAVMLDLGATTTKVGMLVGGLPRERTAPGELAGLRTNLPVPDILTLAVGGATVVQLDGTAPAIGEETVGRRLREEALIFGGSTPTLTDAAVAAGRAELGSHELSAAQRRAVDGTLSLLDDLLAEAVERTRRSTPTAALIAFGGASILLGKALGGGSEVLAPANGDIAGAVGLLVAPAGGQADRICVNRPGLRGTTMEATRAEALARAIHAGADPASVEIVDVEEVPLAYLADPPIRIRVRALGPRL